MTQMTQMLIAEGFGQRRQARVRPKFSLFPDDPRAGLDLDRIEQRSLDYHAQVRKNYLDQVKLDAKRYKVIDAARSVEEVHEDVVKAVSSLGKTT